MESKRGFPSPRKEKHNVRSRDTQIPVPSLSRIVGNIDLEFRRRSRDMEKPSKQERERKEGFGF